MRISDWSSDVCSSDLPYPDRVADLFLAIAERSSNCEIVASIAAIGDRLQLSRHFDAMILADVEAEYRRIEAAVADAEPQAQIRSEEHTSELQSLMRISYAVFCLKTKKKNYEYKKNCDENVT